MDPDCPARNLSELEMNFDCLVRNLLDSEDDFEGVFLFLFCLSENLHHLLLGKILNWQKSYQKVAALCQCKQQDGSVKSSLQASKLQETYLRFLPKVQAIFVV